MENAQLRRIASGLVKFSNAEKTCFDMMVIDKKLRKRKYSMSHSI